MFKNLLKPDSSLMITMTWITDCIFLSLFFLIGCIPVVTVGTSFAALYDASYRSCRQGEKNSWQRFAKVYKDNWKAGIAPGLVLAVVVFSLGKFLIGLWNGAVAGSVSWMVFSGGTFAGMLFLGIFSIMFPMLSRFENSFFGLLKNTVLIGLANMPRTLALGILNGISVFLCARFVVPVFFLPALAALLGSWLIEPMFKPYMPEEEPEEEAAV